MVVTSKSDIGDSYEEIDVETDGEPMKITFNVRYLSDAFRVIKDEYVYLQMTSPVSPITIVPFGGDAFLYLSLPVRAAAKRREQKPPLRPQCCGRRGGDNYTKFSTFP